MYLVSGITQSTLHSPPACRPWHSGILHILNTLKTLNVVTTLHTQYTQHTLTCGCCCCSCPERKDLPSYLLELTSAMGQRMYAGEALRTARASMHRPSMGERVPLLVSYEAIVKVGGG